MPNALPAPVIEAMDRWHDATVATERASVLLRIADAVDEEAAARAELAARIGEAIDLAVANARLKQIDEDPSLVVRGAELDRRLDAAARQPREGERVMWGPLWHSVSPHSELTLHPERDERHSERLLVRPAPEETP